MRSRSPYHVPQPLSAYTSTNDLISAHIMRNPADVVAITAVDGSKNTGRRNGAAIPFPTRSIDQRRHGQHIRACSSHGKSIHSIQRSRHSSRYSQRSTDLTCL